MALDFFKKNRLNIGKGVSGTGSLFGEIADRSGRDIVTLEPGDYANPSTDTIIHDPIAYDLWYLNNTVNILSMETTPKDSVLQTYLDGPLDFLSDKVGSLKPKCFIRNITDLIEPYIITQFLPQAPISALWIQYREYFIHLLAYEMWLSGQCEEFVSAGAAIDHGFDRNKIVGYISFPVGQLGAMEVMSILAQSDTEADDFELLENQKPDFTPAGGGLFPPLNKESGKNYCVGDHLIESGYVVKEEKMRNLEWQSATPYPSGIYALDPKKPQFWVRYWIHADETFPTPGEFLGIVCKSLALPPHIWWFQESNPFLYAGNWFETNNLTGGVVTVVLLEADRTDDGIGNLYTVKVQGREIKINSSDFLAYAVGDRVGVLKIQSVMTTGRADSFKWHEQTRIEESDINTTFNSTLYSIIPIDFYKVI